MNNENRRDWQKVLFQLFEGEFGEGWWDCRWDDIAKDPESYHPFFVYLLNNILSIVTAIHFYSSHIMSMDTSLYQRFTGTITNSTSKGSIDIEDLLESHADIKSLYDRLPVG